LALLARRARHRARAARGAARGRAPAGLLAVQRALDVGARQPEEQGRARRRLHAVRGDRRAAGPALRASAAAARLRAAPPRARPGPPRNLAGGRLASRVPFPGGNARQTETGAPNGARRRSRGHSPRPDRQ
ncbi:MAG: hypothetical protein F9K18_15445, partial [Thermoanaerobaculia bacterium]